MRIFVTGGTGFVGSHFLNAAHAAGHGIVALRRPGSFPRIPLNKEPTWVDGSLDGDHRSAIKGCEVFVHLAAHGVNPPHDRLDRCLYWNLIASLRLCEQAEEVGIRRFVITGSCWEYGRVGDRYKYIPPEAPLEPTTSYGASKAAASVAFFAWATDRGLQLQILRVFNVFGPGEFSSRLWPSLQEAALAGHDCPMTNGEQVRDFILVSDLAQKFVAALGFEGITAGRPIIRNIGSGQPTTVKLFAEYWWHHWGAKGKLIFGALPHRKGEIMRYVPEI